MHRGVDSAEYASAAGGVSWVIVGLTDRAGDSGGIGGVMVVHRGWWGASRGVVWGEAGESGLDAGWGDWPPPSGDVDGGASRLAAGSLVSVPRRLGRGEEAGGGAVGGQPRWGSGTGTQW